MYACGGGAFFLFLFLFVFSSSVSLLSFVCSFVSCFSGPSHPSLGPNHAQTAPQSAVGVQVVVVVVVGVVVFGYDTFSWLWACGVSAPPIAEV